MASSSSPLGRSWQGLQYNHGTELAVAEVGGKIYVVAGSAASDLKIYDPSTDRRRASRRIACLPLKTWRIQSVLCGAAGARPEHIVLKGRRIASLGDLVELTASRVIAGSSRQNAARPKCSFGESCTSPLFLGVPAQRVMVTIFTRRAATELQVRLVERSDA